MEKLTGAGIVSPFRGKTWAADGGTETCCAFVYYSHNLAPGHILSNPCITTLTAVVPCESGDKYLHNSNANDSVVHSNVSALKH